MFPQTPPVTCAMSREQGTPPLQASSGDWFRDMTLLKRRSFGQRAAALKVQSFAIGGRSADARSVVDRWERAFEIADRVFRRSGEGQGQRRADRGTGIDYHRPWHAVSAERRNGPRRGRYHPGKWCRARHHRHHGRRIEGGFEQCRTGAFRQGGRNDPQGFDPRSCPMLWRSNAMAPPPSPPPCVWRRWLELRCLQPAASAVFIVAPKRASTSQPISPSSRKPMSPWSRRAPRLFSICPHT